MLTWLLQVSKNSQNSMLFLIGICLLYITGIVLLAAVVWKFYQYKEVKPALEKQRKHFFSTREMLILVLILFPFWIGSFGQVHLLEIAYYFFFSIGIICVLFATVWHIWAKFNIGRLWSDGIEIKEKHPLQTTGAYALARHPMYASLLLWCWGGSLIMANAITFLVVSLVFLPLMVYRAKAEEAWLLQKNPDYAFYQNNVKMLTVTISGGWSVLVRLILALALCYFTVAHQITLAVLGALVFVHLYLGYSLVPEKTAFSYRSKSGMMAVFGLLGLYVSPVFFYFFYIIVAMCLYGLKWNCPCMLVYEKYHGCPCFALLKKCSLRKKADR
ncbi:MAG: isoprenylcysteine carboxylmethyltransferase family protein [Elusimicrobiaceae bacterium]|nr:isoprenylcysteine carboxylmethyltransferase family protein [Elusimicrobiaceae bacterium]